MEKTKGETKWCSNCKREIAASNFLMHEMHCKRNIELCKECGESIAKDQMSAHYEAVHAPIECDLCHTPVARHALENHKADLCPKRRRPCCYCSLEFAFDQLAEHTGYCGSRTEQCMKCLRYIMLRDQIQHEETNCEFPVQQRPAVQDVPVHVDPRIVRARDFNGLHERMLAAALLYDEGFHTQNRSTGGAELMLPCEFCNRLFPEFMLFQHQLMCEVGGAEDQTTVNEIRDSPIRHGFGDVRRQDWTDEDFDEKFQGLSALEQQHTGNDDLLLPCEFCEDLFPVDLLDSHQMVCDARNLYAPSANGRSAVPSRRGLSRSDESSRRGLSRSDESKRATARVSRHQAPPLWDHPSFSGSRSTGSRESLVRPGPSSSGSHESLGGRHHGPSASWSREDLVHYQQRTTPTGSRVRHQGSSPTAVDPRQSYAHHQGPPSASSSSHHLVPGSHDSLAWYQPGPPFPPSSTGSCEYPGRHPNTETWTPTRGVSGRTGGGRVNAVSSVARKSSRSELYPGASGTLHSLPDESDNGSSVDSPYSSTHPRRSGGAKGGAVSPRRSGGTSGVAVSHNTRGALRSSVQRQAGSHASLARTTASSINPRLAPSVTGPSVATAAARSSTTYTSVADRHRPQSLQQTVSNVSTASAQSPPSTSQAKTSNRVAPRSRPGLAARDTQNTQMTAERVRRDNASNATRKSPPKPKEKTTTPK